MTKAYPLEKSESVDCKKCSHKRVCLAVREYQDVQIKLDVSGVKISVESCTHYESEDMPKAAFLYD